MNGYTVILIPLFLTVLLECAGGCLLGLRQGKQQFLILLVNCLTNPLLVVTSQFLMYNMGRETGLILTYALLEPCVIAAEGILYRNRMPGTDMPFRLSLILNMITIAGGLLWLKITG